MPFHIGPHARAFLATQAEFSSFEHYAWSFVGGQPVHHRFQFQSLPAVPATTPESDAMSKALKKRGFTFVGSTCYSFMQVIGMMNDHLLSCHRHAAVRVMGMRC